MNQPLFDYRDQLRSGTITLPCWPVSPEEPLEDLFNPIGEDGRVVRVGRVVRAGRGGGVGRGGCDSWRISSERASQEEHNGSI